MPQASILRLAARRRRFLIEWALVAVAAAALLAALSFGHGASRLDNLAYDAVSRLTPIKPSANIVIVAIDNDSLAALGRWPWSRRMHAQLLERLSESGVHRVAYDVLFPEPAADPEDDAALARSLTRVPTWLPVLLEAPGRNGAEVEVSLPAGPLAKAAAGLGHVNLGFDTDGVARRIFLRESANGQAFDHLVVGVSGTGQSGPLRDRLNPQQALAQGGLTRSGEVLFPFAPAGAFVTVPFAAVMRGEVPKSALWGKTVLVGATAPGLHDHYETPARDLGGMPGVEVQANLLNAIEQGQLRQTASNAAVFSIGLIALASVMAGFLVLSARGGLILLAVTAATLIAASIVALTSLHLWLSPVSALLMMAVLYPSWSWRRLEAASSYMLRELEQFRADDEVWRSAGETPVRGDQIGRQLDLMDRAVSSLRALQRLVSAGLHGLPDAVIVLDADGKAALVNDNGVKLFGPEARGRSWSEFTAGWRGEPNRAFAPPHDGEECDGLSPDGRIWRIRSAGRGEEYLIVRFTDVTEARLAAENRERLLAFLSHDMRSPQASIIALVSQAKVTALAPDLGAQLKAYAERTLTLADDFIHLARAQADAYAMAPTGLADVLMDAYDETWPQVIGLGRTLEMSELELEPVVLGDRAMLSRAVVNLISNALKYSDAGLVACSLQRGGDGVSIIVSDHGHGMTAEEVEQAFKPFQQLGGRGSKGAGLGLAFVQTVVTRHGGRIRCESAPGRGTSIRLSFPELREEEPGPELH